MLLLVVLAALPWSCPAGAGELFRSEGPPPAGFKVYLHGALGAQAVLHVGEDADLVLHDPLLRRTVRLAGTALDVQITGPFGLFGRIRLEEGLFHGGSLDSVEALLGWLAHPGYVGTWLGRGDIRYSRDRDAHAEDHALSIRPTLSRVLLPEHGNGAGVGVAWPGRMSLLGGVSFSSVMADAPHLWARFRMHPLGNLPSDVAGPASGPLFQLAAGVVHRPTGSLGELSLLSVDGTFRWRSLSVEVGWTAQMEPVGRDQWIWEVGSTIVPIPGGSDIHLYARLERTSNLVPGERVRWTVGTRLSWRVLDRRLHAYVELWWPFEQGGERRNETVAVGVLGRL